MSEEYMSCKYIESAILFSNSAVALCCVPPLPIFQKTSEFDVDYYLAVRAKQRHEPLPQCAACHNYKMDKWENSGKLKTIFLSTGDGCNFRCEYCSTTNPNHSWGAHVDVLPHLEKLYERGLMADKCLFSLAGGEPALLKDVDKILEFAEKVNAFVAIHSNCSIYNNSFARLMGKRRASIKCSIDAGTRETFKKIKGVDCFNTVVENLKKYASTGGEIYTKYIIYGQNYQREEVVAYVKTIRDIKVRQSIFTFDLRDAGSDISNPYIDAAALGAFLCDKLGIPIVVDSVIYNNPKFALLERIKKTKEANHKEYEELFKKEFASSFSATAPVTPTPSDLDICTEIMSNLLKLQDTILEYMRNH